VSLNNCFKKAGKAVSKKDRDAIQSLVDDGYTEQEAVNEHLKAIDAELSSIADRAEKAGGTVNREPDNQVLYSEGDKYVITKEKDLIEPLSLFDALKESMNEAEINKVYEQFDKEIQAKKDQIKDVIENSTAPIFANGSGSLFYTVTPAANSDYKYQVTVWDNKGAISDSKHNTVDDIYNNYSGEFKKITTESELNKLIGESLGLNLSEPIEPYYAKSNLDMSKKARMKRAKQMGFDTSKVWYHGTEEARPFNEFLKDKIKSFI